MSTRGFGRFRPLWKKTWQDVSISWWWCFDSDVRQNNKKRKIDFQLLQLMCVQCININACKILSCEIYVFYSLFSSFSAKLVVLLFSVITQKIPSFFLHPNIKRHFHWKWTGRVRHDIDASDKTTTRVSKPLIWRSNIILQTTCSHCLCFFPLLQQPAHCFQRFRAVCTLVPVHWTLVAM